MSGIRGRSKASVSLGSDDPRGRRNDQASTRGSDYVYPLQVDDYGRLSLALSEWLDSNRRYVTDVGDGSATSFTIQHGLGTRDIFVVAYLKTTGVVQSPTTLTYTNKNTVTIVLGSAPTASNARVIVSK